MALSPNDVIKKNYKSIEELYKEHPFLNWGNFVDVLYSFTGIIALGLYIKNKDKYTIWENGKIAYITPPYERKIQQLGTKNHLKELLNENNSDLIDLIKHKEIIDFAGVYNSVGNLIPIWPGGNEFKGKALIKNKYAYDIPNIFFTEFKNMEIIYLEKELKITIEDAALENFLTKDHLLIESISIIQNYNETDYYTFVACLVEEIKNRETKIQNLCSTVAIHNP